MNPTLENYETLSTTHKQALSAAQAIKSEFRTCAPRWLTYAGVTGQGKSHLLKALRREAETSGLETIWCSWKTACNQAVAHDKELLEFAKDAEFLALDDLGAEHRCDYATSLLYDLLEDRLGKWTVITANLSLEQIANTYDVRIASRLLRGGPVIEFHNGADYALRNEVWRKNGRPLTKEQKLALREKELAPHHVSRLPEEKLEEMRKRLQSLANHLTTH